MEDKMKPFDMLQALRKQRDKAKRDYEELSTAIRRIEEFLGGSTEDESDDTILVEVTTSINCKGLSQANAAELALKHAGRYLAVGNIVADMLLGGFEYDGDLKKLKASVNTVLYKSPKFMKHKTIRGTYGLAEWGPEKAEALTSN